MKKLILMIAAIAAVSLGLFAQDASVSKPATTEDLSAKVAQYEKAIPVLIQQRNALSSQLLDFQAQLTLASQEIERLTKELAEEKAKHASITQPLKSIVKN